MIIPLRPIRLKQQRIDRNAMQQKQYLLFDGILKLINSVGNSVL